MYPLLHMVFFRGRGRSLAIEQCSRLLQAVWPRLTEVLPYLGSQELAACLQAYWWQMLYNREEVSVTGIARCVSIQGDSTNHKAATEELKTKLLWPILSRLGEMRLRDIGKTLTTIAPPVHCEDVLDVDQRFGGERLRCGCLSTCASWRDQHEC